MTAAPAIRLRSLKLGDCWFYDVSGGITPASGDPRALSGTIAVSIAPDALSNAPHALMLLFNQKFEVALPDGSREAMPAPEWMFSFAQDAATRDVAIVADNMGPGGGARIAKIPQVFYPGEWSRFTRYENRLEFGEGDYVANTLAVVGEEWLETPAGSFLSWKSVITSESPAMGRIDGMDWWTPELGAPAGFETESGMPDGSRMRFRAMLSRTNVVPDPA